MARIPTCLRGTGQGARLLSEDDVRLAGQDDMVVFYAPEEQVVRVSAAMPVADLSALLSEHKQYLAFEPSAVAGRSLGLVGGMVGMNLSGARRLTHGACRDHVLGLSFFDGRGQLHRAGGRVMKNVTGLDLVKLLTGSRGTLAALLDVTFRTVPQPESSVSLVYKGMSLVNALDLMAEALRSPFGVTGAVYAPSSPSCEGYVALRLEGFFADVHARYEALRVLLATRFGSEPPSVWDAKTSPVFWQRLADGRAFDVRPNDVVFELHVPALSLVSVCAELAPQGWQLALTDWGGSRSWLVGPLQDAEDMAGNFRALQSCVRRHHGWARLLHGSDTAIHVWRAAVMAFPSFCSVLEQRLKRAFDPYGLFPDLMRWV